VVDRALRQVSGAIDGDPGEVVDVSLRLGESTGGGHRVAAGSQPGPGPA
jgi:hypothetical protein